MTTAKQITFSTQNGLQVPDQPIIPYIAGDGIGPEVWQAARTVIDAAVTRYQPGKKIAWKEVLAGGHAHEKTGEWLPDATLNAFKNDLVGIKGPLMTPVGGGIRSLNVTLRKEIDLFACVRPIEWFKGVPSPVRNPQDVNMTIFRENTEDVYSGIEWKCDSDCADKLKTFLREELDIDSIRFPDTTSFGLKPISIEGSQRIVRAAIQYAISQGEKKVTLIHKGNIMKYTEGMFRDVGYAVAKEEFSAETFTWITYEDIKKSEGQDAAAAALKKAETEGKVIITDCIADAFFQNALLDPSEYSVVVATNLNGDYVSDALAAQVGGIGISPGANINYNTGHAIFEATHGTAPTIAGQDKANPCAMILSGIMLLDYLGWTTAAKALKKAIQTTIENKTVTADFNMENAEIVGTKGFTKKILDAL